jgi:hypothetical protein
MKKQHSEDKKAEYRSQNPGARRAREKGKKPGTAVH